MSNPYFNASGAPANRSAGASATIRAEFAAIAAGLKLLSMGLNGIPVGATTPSTGAFTTLSASGATTLVALTTTGNTILGDATTDTFNQGAGSLVKNAAGNWTFAAPSSGATLVVNGGNLLDGISYQGLANGFPLTIRDIAAAPNNATQAFIGLSTAALTGANGDIVIIPRTSTNGSFRVYTGNVGLAAERFVVGPNGNVTIATPSSGVTLALSTSALGLRQTTNVARGGGSNWIQFSDPSGDSGYVGFGGATSIMTVMNQIGVLNFGANGSTWLTLDTNGRLFGAALHNNAAGAAGTTTQHIASGTYTPTFTAVSNVDSATARAAQWIRVGNVVHVTGQVSIDATASTNTVLGISLPIPSALASAGQLAGAGAGNQVSGIAAATITADTTNDRAQLEFTNASTSACDWTFTFSYVVL